MAKKSLDDLLGLVSNNPEAAAKLLKNANQLRDEYELTEEQMASIAGAGQFTHTEVAYGKYPDPTVP